jgi:hypothetical protein
MKCGRRQLCKQCIFKRLKSPQQDILGLSSKIILIILFCVIKTLLLLTAFPQKGRPYAVNISKIYHP